MEGEQTNTRVIVLGIILFVVLMGVMYFMSLEQRDALKERGVVTESQYSSELTMIEERTTLTPEEMASLLATREEALRLKALRDAGVDVDGIESEPESLETNEE